MKPYAAIRIYAATLFFSIAASSVHAQETPPIKVTGHFRLRTEGNRFTDFASDRDFFTVRLRPRFQLTTAEYQLVFTPQFAKILGSPASTSGTTADPNMGVHEAYAIYPASSRLQFIGGRMILSYGDELVIGALEWNNVARSFDGFKTSVGFESGWIDFFAMKIAENNSSPPTSPDQDLFGAYSHFESTTWLQTIEIYVLGLQSSSGNAANRLWAAGVRNAAKHGGFDRRIEATLETGDGTPLPASPFQVDAEIGYRFDSKPKPRFSLEYFVAGQGYHQLYPTTHKWLGYADVLGRRNLTGFAIHSELTPSDLLKLKLEYHRFDRYQSAASVYKPDGLSSLGSVSGSSASQVGSELDFTAAYQLEKTVLLTGGVSAFFTGDFLRNSFPDRTPTFYFVQAEFNF